jgi:ribosomal protein S20
MAKTPKLKLRSTKDKKAVKIVKRRKPTDPREKMSSSQLRTALKKTEADLERQTLAYNRLAFSAAAESITSFADLEKAMVACKYPKSPPSDLPMYNIEQSLTDVDQSSAPSALADNEIRIPLSSPNLKLLHEDVFPTVYSVDFDKDEIKTIVDEQLFGGDTALASELILKFTKKLKDLRIFLSHHSFKCRLFDEPETQIILMLFLKEMIDKIKVTKGYKILPAQGHRLKTVTKLAHIFRRKTAYLSGYTDIIILKRGFLVDNLANFCASIEMRKVWGGA